MSLDEVVRHLRLFDQDPKRAMNERPVKRDAQGRVIESVESLFPSDDIASGAYIEHRDQFRKKIQTERDGQRIVLEQILPGRAPFAQNDRAEDLVDIPSDQILRRLEDMERRSLRSARLDETPWGTFYWPPYLGGVAFRFGDPEFPRSEDWKKNHDYIVQNPASAIAQSGDPAAIDRLSPAEKYDLLCGGALASAAWAEGARIYKDEGKVPTWFGICHGWAPACFTVERPRYKVKLPAADQKTQLVFYPADIKALVSLLWANAPPMSRFIGGRCNDKSPALDENGRTTSEDCFDTNPGTWHLSVVNQIGVARRSCIIDATFDFEVWNQPLYAYEYTYFNPQTRQPAATLDEATVERSHFTADRFRRYRSAEARYMVGIAMELTYVVETFPTQAERDSREFDAVRTVSYLYDVELDAERRIIGGEWYTNRHSDFIWTPEPGATVQSVADYAAVGEWSGSGPLPEAWLQAAVSAAQKRQPLGRLVDLLVNFAQ